MIKKQGCVCHGFASLCAVRVFIRKEGNFVLEIGSTALTRQEAFKMLENRINKRIPSSEAELKEYLTFAQRLNISVAESEITGNGKNFDVRR